ncbi:MAG TPA: response regulator transcription factor [Candidatus Dormibacteraeota bacterium]
MAAREAPVLVVDDDPKVVALVGAYLERAGFEVITATDGESAERLVREAEPRLVVLDVMLPRLDGLSLMRSLRDRHHPVPVLILSALGTLDDRLRGLADGADDYLPKPFSPAELVQRASAILRRAEGPSSRVLLHQDLTIDLDRHTVERNGEPLRLSPAELQILVALVRARGRVLTRDQLLDELHGLGELEVTPRSVDVHLSRLRSRLGRDREYLETIRGVGYKSIA